MIHAGGRNWYTANEVTEQLWPDVSPEAVRQWARRGKVNGHRVGRETYYDLNALTEAEYQVRRSGAGRPRQAAETGIDRVTS